MKLLMSPSLGSKGHCYATEFGIASVPHWIDLFLCLCPPL